MLAVASVVLLLSFNPVHPFISPSALQQHTRTPSQRLKSPSRGSEFPHLSTKDATQRSTDRVPSMSITSHITERSRLSLEYASVLQHVASHATTTIGQSLILSSNSSTCSQSVNECHTLYSQLSEMLKILTPTSTETPSSLFPHTSNDLSLSSLLTSLRKTSAVLEFEEFLNVIDTLSYINHIQTFFSTLETQKTYPSLFKLAGQYIFVPPDLLQTLEKAFDCQTGQLSLSTYPQLSSLKSQISSKKSLIQSTLNSIISELPPTSLPSDSTPSLNIINNRYTISVNPSSMRSVGILHSRSR